jgi:hypothetical protein
VENGVTHTSDSMAEQHEVQAVTITTLSLRLRNMDDIKIGFAEVYYENLNKIGFKIGPKSRTLW